MTQQFACSTNVTVELTTLSIIQAHFHHVHAIDDVLKLIMTLIFGIVGTRYHFTTGEVDSGFVSEIKQLNSLNEEKLFGLIGMIIDFLADPKVGTQNNIACSVERNN